jgi:hypothetical protein
MNVLVDAVIQVMILLKFIMVFVVNFLIVHKFAIKMKSVQIHVALLVTVVQ